MTQSAGIVLWRTREAMDGIEILLAHPGGPFWAAKDEHAWSIPKGEFDPDAEGAWDAACREFEEELGCPPPTADAEMIPPFRAGRKWLHVWLVRGDFDSTVITPDDQHRSMVELAWPPRSGKTALFPEIDRVQWVGLDRAIDLLHKGHAPLVPAIEAVLGGTNGAAEAEPDSRNR